MQNKQQTYFIAVGMCVIGTFRWCTLTASSSKLWISVVPFCSSVYNPELPHVLYNVNINVVQNQGKHSVQVDWIPYVARPTGQWVSLLKMSHDCTAWCDVPHRAKKATAVSERVTATAKCVRNCPQMKSNCRGEHRHQWISPCFAGSEPTCTFDKASWPDNVSIISFMSVSSMLATCLLVTWQAGELPHSVNPWTGAAQINLWKFSSNHTIFC